MVIVSNNFKSNAYFEADPATVIFSTGNRQCSEHVSWSARRSLGVGVGQEKKERRTSTASYHICEFHISTFLLERCFLLIQQQHVKIRFAAGGLILWSGW